MKKQSSVSSDYWMKIFLMPVHKLCGCKKKKACASVPVRVEQLTSSNTPAPS